MISFEVVCINILCVKHIFNKVDIINKEEDDDII